MKRFEIEIQWKTKIFTCKNIVHSICNWSSRLRQLYKTFKLIGRLDAKQTSKIAREISIRSWILSFINR